MKLKLLFFCPAILVSFLFVPPAIAQRQGPPKPLPAGEVSNNGTISVKVYAAAGSAIDSEPSVVLTTGGNDGPVTNLPTQISRNEWRFQGLQVGTEYVVRIEAKGFETKQQYVTIPPFENGAANITVYLVPSARAENPFPPPPGHFALSPQAQREVHEAMKDLKSNKNSAARQHLKKAIDIAPNHPGVNYLMGLSYVRDHQAALAVPYLKKSLAIDPSQEPALMALGMALYQQGEYSATIDLFNKSAPGISSWQAQWILAGCYLHEKNYEQALQHAQEALKRGKKEAKRARLMLGEAFQGLGRRQEAIEAFETFLKENSHDPDAAAVRATLQRLREPAAQPAPVRASGGEGKPGAANASTLAYAGSSHGSPPERPAAPQPAAPPPPVAPHKVTALLPMVNWAPPDVDAARPLVSSAACRLSSLLASAGRSTAEWVNDLQEFTATEDYQSVEIGHHGDVGRPFEKKFSYLVFIHKPRPNLFDVQEQRIPNPVLARMGAPVIALGSPALALVFHPTFAHEYKWTCEGLGKWEGKPAWIVRFRQRTDQPTSMLESFEDGSKSYFLPLKGIAWLSEKGDHVMHLETDIVEPIPAIRLEREHFSIDYRLVAFRTHPVKLWLPERVDLYILYRGHAYHNYAHYSHFLLFWTGAAQTIGSAKQDHPPQ
jgi:tetratricopeptide (TPR) repeat protein